MSKTLSLSLKLSSFCYKELDKCISEVVSLFKERGYAVKVAMLPVKTEKFTIGRAFFVDSKTKEHFESRTYSRVLTFSFPVSELYLISQTNLPSVVEITKSWMK